MMNANWLEDYARIEQAIHFLEESYYRQPSLADVAASVGLSEYHFQRLFTRWAGISPKKFLQYVTKEHAKRLLAASGDLLTATYGTGLSAPSRLHDLFVTFEAVTPGEFKRSGEGIEITYGFHASPFGEYLLAQTGRGICRLAFIGKGGRQAEVADLRRRWRNARLIENPDATQAAARRVFPDGETSFDQPLHLLLKGTNFQIKVWEALLQIPSGIVVSYETVAQSVGSPTAVRAVGSAIGQNPINYLIPCHRVIRKSGEVHQYQSGTARKKAILAWETARFETARPEAA